MTLGILVIPGTTRIRSRRTGLVPACSGGYVRPIERDRGAGGGASPAALNKQAPRRAGPRPPPPPQHPHLPPFPPLYAAPPPLVQSAHAHTPIIHTYLV